MHRVSGTLASGSSVSAGMSHRIEIELTSSSGDGTWTWRAAGAKQPRGSVAGDLVPDGTAVGTILRAEVESTLDGMSVIALLPAKGKETPKPVERIEIALGAIAPRVRGARRAGEHGANRRPTGPLPPGVRDERAPLRYPTTGGGTARPGPAQADATATGGAGVARALDVHNRRPPIATPRWPACGPSSCP